MGNRATRVRAWAPGRVNLIGDHTDYTGGFVLPMAVNMGTTIEGERGGDRVVLQSADEAGTVDLPLDVTDPSTVDPAWGRFIAGAIVELRPAAGLRGEVRTTLPVGAGLSSSSALVVAAVLSLGFDGSAVDLARACQRAEIAATAVRGGIMDQLTAASAIEGHALLIDCTSLDVTPVPLPADVEVVVVHSGQRRTLAATAYSERRAQCDEAAAVVGPLRSVTVADLTAIKDGVVRRRARHVLSENARVLAMADALRAGELAGAGALMTESHASLRDDFEVSTPVLDALVERLVATPGVHGARLTGAGFGGCVVALAEPGAVVDGWRVRAAGPATIMQGTRE